MSHIRVLAFLSLLAKSALAAIPTSDCIFTDEHVRSNRFGRPNGWSTFANYPGLVELVLPDWTEQYGGTELFTRINNDQEYTGTFYVGVVANPTIDYQIDQNFEIDSENQRVDLDFSEPVSWVSTATTNSPNDAPAVVDIAVAVEFSSTLNDTQITTITDAFCEIVNDYSNGRTATCEGTATATSYTFTATFSVEAADLAAFSATVLDAYQTNLGNAVIELQAVTAANGGVPLTPDAFTTTIEVERPSDDGDGVSGVCSDRKVTVWNRWMGVIPLALPLAAFTGGVTSRHMLVILSSLSVLLAVGANDANTFDSANACLSAVVAASNKPVLVFINVPSFFVDVTDEVNAGPRSVVFRTARYVNDGVLAAANSTALQAGFSVEADPCQPAGTNMSISPTMVNIELNADFFAQALNFTNADYSDKAKLLCPPTTNYAPEFNVSSVTYQFTWWVGAALAATADYQPISSDSIGFSQTSRGRCLFQTVARADLSVPGLVAGQSYEVKMQRRLLFRGAGHTVQSNSAVVVINPDFVKTHVSDPVIELGDDVLTGSSSPNFRLKFYSNCGVLNVKFAISNDSSCANVLYDDVGFQRYPDDYMEYLDSNRSEWYDNNGDFYPLGNFQYDFPDGRYYFWAYFEYNHRTTATPCPSAPNLFVSTARAERGNSSIVCGPTLEAAYSSIVPITQISMAMGTGINSYNRRDWKFFTEPDVSQGILPEAFDTSIAITTRRSFNLSKIWPNYDFFNSGSQWVRLKVQNANGIWNDHMQIAQNFNAPDLCN